MTAFVFGEETERVEFKKSTSELKEAVISIAAMLNKHGSGDLYFGVRNNGEVIGQEITDRTLREVSQAIRANIKPIIYPEIEKEAIGDRFVVHVHVKGYAQPYLAYDRPRIRVADEDVMMDQATYERMLRLRDDAGKSWENRLSDYTVQDIDKEAFRRFLKRAKDENRIALESSTPDIVLRKLELLDGATLLNAGAALFVDSSINELQMAKFASDERLTITDLRRYTGSIFTLLQRAEEYLVDAMDWRAVFNGSMRRIELPEIPVDALREALVNAFAHREIESGQSVDVAILRSRIEIYSPGKFPSDLTPEMFIERNEKPIRRNPRIARILYCSHDMEGFATGLKRIQQLCDEAGCKVEYRKEAYGFTVVFHRSPPKGISQVTPQVDASFMIKGEKILQGEGNTPQVTPQVTPPVEVPKNLTEKEERLLEFCTTPRSVQEMMDFLELSDRKHFRKRYLSLLLGRGLLRMTNPEAPRSSLQRYVIVGKAEA